MSLTGPALPKRPEGVCFGPCTPDVLNHSHAPAATLDPPRRAKHAQEGTLQFAPPTARRAADKMSSTQSALKVSFSSISSNVATFIGVMHPSDL